MISVQNLRLQLSGNKIFLLSLLFLLSCTASRRAKKDDVQIVKANDKENDKDVVTPKTDNDNDARTGGKDSSTKDAGTKRENVGIKKSSYNLSLFLPFTRNDADRKYLQFYAGAKLASQVLEEEGVNLTIEVADVKDLSALNKLNVDNTHLIFGPNDEQSLKPIIDFGKKNKIPVVSSWFSLSSVEDNPYYIQLKPSSRAHFSAMVAHIKKNFAAKDVVIVGRESKNDRTWFSYFQAEAKRYYGVTDEFVFTEKIISDSLLIHSNRVFFELLSMGKKVFIFPNYSYKDENYLVQSFKKLSAELGGKKIYTYGMPILKDSELITKEMYEKLNIRIPASKFVNSGTEEIRSFDIKFLDMFGSLPDADAYEGYDNMLFIARCLARYGTNFQYLLKEDKSYYLQTAFDIQPIKSDNSANEMDYFENRHLDILEYDGFKFSKIQR